MRLWDVVVIGGGASGLTAAITAAEAGAQVLVLEAADRVGKKLLATGNGRCNLSNRTLVEHPENASAYYGMDAALCNWVYGQCTPQSTLDFWARLGIPTVSDREGRLYPRSMQASAVLDALRYRAGEAAEIRCGVTVDGLSLSAERWIVRAGELRFDAKTVVLAAGCAAGNAPDTMPMLKTLGLSEEPVYPSLCPIFVQQDALRGLKGVRVHGKVGLLADEVQIAAAEGEIQCNQNNLSGICIFDLSRYVGEFLTGKTVRGKSCKACTLSVNLVPEMPPKALLTLLHTLYRNLQSQPAEQLLAGLLPKKIGMFLLHVVAPDAGALVGDLNPAILRKLAAKMQDWRFIPTALSPWSLAQSGSVGVPASALRPESLELVRCPGIYLTGDLLSPLGDCGGYHLQWAWSTGIIAGMAAAERSTSC